MKYEEKRGTDSFQHDLCIIVSLLLAAAIESPSYLPVAYLVVSGSSSIVVELLSALQVQSGRRGIDDIGVCRLIDRPSWTQR